MAIDITMPALSPTMTEGTLARWVKKEGDSVKSGDVLLEIETDKATMEVEAVDEGKIGSILVADGTEGVKVGTVIAVLFEEGETEAPKKQAKSPKPASPKENVEKQPATEPVSRAKEPAEQPAPKAPTPEAKNETRLFASPLARRIAAEKGIELQSVTGSGPHGRIVKADVEQALAAGPAKPATAKPSPQPMAVSARKDQVQALAGGIGYDLVPHTNMRRAIARRLTESKQTVPHFYLTVDCEIDALLNARTNLNKLDEASKISVNDFVVRAAALALRKVPAANASWSEDGTLLWQSVDVAVAVALDEGLITPIVKNADQKGLGAISREMKDLAKRAREGKLKLEEFQGGTFSISNLGMFGIKEFSAVINPPHGCILAIGAGEQRAVVKDGALAVATVMSCTLSVDHRVVDGSVGAEFLRVFKRFVETPLSMLL